MGDILSFLLDIPPRYKKNIFLNTSSRALSSMVYRNENVLVIESKIKDGCRVLLIYRDVTNLLRVERCIFEIANRKSIVVHPMIQSQIRDMVETIKINENCRECKTIDDMTTSIRSIDADKILENMHVLGQSFVGQLKLLVIDRLAECCLAKMEDSYLCEVSVIIK